MAWRLWKPCSVWATCALQRRKVESASLDGAVRRGRGARRVSRRMKYMTSSVTLKPLASPLVNKARNTASNYVPAPWWCPLPLQTGSTRPAGRAHCACPARACLSAREPGCPHICEDPYQSCPPALSRRVYDKRVLIFGIKLRFKAVFILSLGNGIEINRTKYSTNWLNQPSRSGWGSQDGRIKRRLRKKSHQGPKHHMTPPPPKKTKEVSGGHEGDLHQWTCKANS